MARVTPFSHVLALLFYNGINFSSIVETVIHFSSTI